MAFEVGSIIAKFGIDLTDFDKGVSTVVAKTEAMAKTITEKLSKIGIGGNFAKAAADLGKTIGTMASTNVLDPFMRGFKHLPGFVSGWLQRTAYQIGIFAKSTSDLGTKIWSGISSGFKGTAAWVEQNISGPFSRGFNRLPGFVTGALQKSMYQFGIFTKYMGTIGSSILSPFEKVGKYLVEKLNLAAVGRSISSFFGGAMTIAAGTVKMAFAALTPIVVGSAKLIVSTLMAIPGQLKDLGKKIFGMISSPLGAVLGGLGVYEMIRLTNEAERVRVGFDYLMRSVGSVSDVMMTKLRAATRGAVSDMDLMRMANAGVLLGVVRTDEEFARITNSARRLGNAMGIDINYAMQSITYALGRQSRLWLDNIGIIVDATGAQAAYANSVNKSVADLTGQERKLVFQAEAMRKMDAKLKEMGPDVLLVADAWSHLGASIQNAVIAFTRNAIGAEIPNLLSSFIERLTPKLAAIGKFVGEEIKSILKIAKDIFNRFASGLITPSDVIAWFTDAFVAGVKMLVYIVVRSGFSLLGTLISRLLPGLILTISAIVIRLITDIIETIGGLIADLVGEIKESWGKGMRDVLNDFLRSVDKNKLKEVKDTIGGLMGDEETAKQKTRLLGLVDEAAVNPGKNLAAAQEAIRQFYAEAGAPKYGERLADNLARAVTSSKVQRAFEWIGDKGGQELAGGLVEALKNGYLIITDEGEKFIRQTFGKAGDEMVDSWRRNQKQLGIDITDPLFKFRIPLVAKELDPLREKLEGLLKFRNQILEGKTTGIYGNLFGKMLGTPEGIRALDLSILGLSQTLILAHNAFQALKKVFVKPFMDPIDFSKEMEPLQDILFKLQEESPVAAYKEDLKEYAKLSLGLERARLNKLTDEMKAAVDSMKMEGARNVLEIEIGKLQQGLVTLDKEAALIAGKAKDLIGDEAATAIAEMRQQVEQLLELYPEMQAYTDLWEFYLYLLDETAKAAKSNEAAKAMAQGLEETRGVQEEIEDWGLTEGERRLAQKRRAYNRIITTGEANADQIKVMRKDYEDAIKQENTLLWKNLSKEISTSIFTGISEGLAKGERGAKVWARVWENVFQSAMTKTIDSITNYLGDMIGTALGKAGIGQGLASAAMGAIAVGGLIMSAIKSKKEAVVESFEDQVTSSEAMRGVVVGPTNVAIAKVGNQLKQALSGTELLLSRIATAVETMAGMRTPGSQTNLTPIGAGYRLSGSTT